MKHISTHVLLPVYELALTNASVRSYGLGGGDLLNLDMHFIPLRPDNPRSADVSPQAIVRQPAGEASPTPALHSGKGTEVHT